MPLGNGAMGAAVWARERLHRAAEPQRHVAEPPVARSGDDPGPRPADRRRGLPRQRRSLRRDVPPVRRRHDRHHLRARRQGPAGVDVTGADPTVTQTARMNLQTGRNPTAGADDGIARLAETWVDTASFTGGTGKTFGSLAAVTAGGRDVTARVVDARTAEISFRPQRGRHVPRDRRRARRGPAATRRAGATNAIGSDTTRHDQRRPHRLVAATTGPRSASCASRPPTAPRTTWRTCARSSSTSRARPSAARSRRARRARTRCSTSAATARAGAAATTGTGTCACTSRPTWARATPTPTCRASASTATTSRTSAQWTHGAHGRCGPASACRRRCASTARAGTRAPTTATRAASRPGEPEWNRRNLTTGAKVGLAMWRHYLATDDRAFLEHNYPLMADAARFLLAYAVEGADGKLHTSARPTRTRRSGTSPTRSPTSLAMKTLFPIVVEAATLLGQRRAAGRPAAGRDPEDPRPPDRDPQQPDRVRLLGEPDLAQLRNVENLDLEPVFPFNTVTDQTPADVRDGQGARYATRRFVNANDWSLDAVDAARLHNGAEVAARLRATTQLLPDRAERPRQPRPPARPTSTTSTPASPRWRSTRRSRPDFDGLAAHRARGPAGLERRGHGLPAAPLEGARPGPGRRDHHGGVVNGPAARDIRVKNPWPGQDVQVGQRRRARHRRRAPRAPPRSSRSRPRPTAATCPAPERADDRAAEGAPLTAPRRPSARHLANANVRIGLDAPGYEPPGPCPIADADAAVRVGPDRGRQRSATGRATAVTASGPAAPPTYLATGPTGSSAEHHRHALPAHARPRRWATCARRRGRRRSRSTPAPPTAASGTGRRRAAATTSAS